METTGKNLDNSEMNRNKEKTIYDPSDFRIERTKKEDSELYIKYVQDYFFTREPMSVGLQIPPPEYERLTKIQVANMIENETSTVAWYVPTNEIAAFTLTAILTKETPTFFGMDDTSVDSEKVKKMMAIVAFLEKSVNLFEDPKVTKAVDIAMTVGVPKFSGNRLIYRITEELERTAVKCGCQIATSQSTNGATQHMRKKMGYETMFSLDYSTFEFEGRRVYDPSQIPSSSTCVKVLRKYLKTE